MNASPSPFENRHRLLLAVAVSSPLFSFFHFIYAKLPAELPYLSENPRQKTITKHNVQRMRMLAASEDVPVSGLVWSPSCSHPPPLFAVYFVNHMVQYLHAPTKACVLKKKAPAGALNGYAFVVVKVFVVVIGQSNVIWLW